ncbi:MAG: hypothetical protein N4A57_16960 [Anaeromicrobium sp.]|jgi:hypothetical protein|uniref:hypothetical protein n=1 Tax=Anaeromicrobium sp. TaxID=1929132 RepID=UPI0025D693A7|nr:hypothetical protein [Anaeromicrobium sp.]MCT4595938.1 hypothetical protein [Anaeromicrobium sp.]
MKISDLTDLEQNKISNYTKKHIRKYFKGLKNGSLKYDSFINTLFSCEEWQSYGKLIFQDVEFKQSIYSFIENTMDIYDYTKENYFYNSISNTHILSSNSKKIMSLKEKKIFMKMLKENGYTLIIPIRFLTERECEFLEGYILNNCPIPLGWQRVLNYIKKST